MPKFDYDLICLGSGSAGGAAAFVAKKAVQRVAVAEEFKDKLGGNCPNYACVPTKALLNAAKIYKLIGRAAEFGVTAENPGFDFAKIAAYRDEVVNTLTGPRIERNLANAGIDLLWGRARFISSHEVEIGEKRYSAEHILIATGSKEFVPPIPGLAEAGFLTSDDASRLKDLPQSVIIIGGGPVGTEFSQIFSCFGVKVILLQREDQILPREDREIASNVEKQLREQGVEIVLGMNVEEVRREGGERVVKIEAGGKSREVRAEKIMIAAGRRAALKDLNLEAAGLSLNDRGLLPINEYLQTEQAHIWAAGDAAGNWQFTHTAAYEGDLVGRNICHRIDQAADYNVVPRVTFCEPETASVGMTEAQARKEGREVKIAKFLIGGLGRALIDRDRRGLIKVVIDQKTGGILGAGICGNGAGQVIHEIAAAMKGKLKAADLGRMIHAYPTYSEAIAAALEQ